jgi:hypothetical protein
MPTRLRFRFDGFIGCLFFPSQHGDTKPRGTTTWQQFHKAVELDRQFVLFFSEVMFLMIPKRSLPDETTLDNFRSQLADLKVGTTKSRSA